MARISTTPKARRIYTASFFLAVGLFLVLSRRTTWFLSVSNVEISPPSVYQSLVTNDWGRARRPQTPTADPREALLASRPEDEADSLDDEAEARQMKKADRLWKHGNAEDLPPRPHSKSRVPFGNYPTNSTMVPPCEAIDGAEDVFVVLRTGATTAHDRLPVHFDTTLRCIPHSVVYSDLSEPVAGHHVEDVLTHLDPSVTRNHEQLSFYREQQKFHRENPSKPITSLLEDRPADEMKEDSKPWQLDKWKFFPLLERALELRPEAKWYVFMEDDSHVVWSNMVLLLRNYDWLKPLYIGSHNFIGDIHFAHGGSVFALSNTALRMAVGEYRRNRGQWDDTMSTLFCGDSGVGLLLEQMGVPITGAWPVIQGATTGLLEWNDIMWCRPVASFHHLIPFETKAMWDFEQDWIHRYAKMSDTEGGRSRRVKSLEHHPITQRDVFYKFFSPQIRRGRVEAWDNLSNDRVLTEANEDMDVEEIQGTQSEDGCRAVCVNDAQCLQWSYVPGRCGLGYELRLGEAVSMAKWKKGEENLEDEDGVVSAWMAERVEETTAAWDTTCQGIEWVYE